MFVERDTKAGKGVGWEWGVPVLQKRKVVVKAKAGREGPLVLLSERLKDGRVNSRGSVPWSGAKTALVGVFVLYI